MISPRLLSLSGVCISSIALSITLHASQANDGHSFNASIAVFVCEVVKLILSLFLAFFDTWSQQAAARSLNVHPLPSPELYDLAGEVEAVSLYSADPFTLPGPLQASLSHHVRRRSSNRHHRPTPLSDVRPHHPQTEKARIARDKQEVLNRFSFPTSPVLAEAFQRAGVIRGEKEPDGVLRYLPISVLRRVGSDITEGWWKMGIPSVLFAVQNNLIYVAARNLSVPAFQVSFQAKTIITALAAVVMLKRRLALHQWIALAVLGFGVGTMQLGTRTQPESDASLLGEPAQMDHLLGFSSVLISCVASAIAATYFELVIKHQPTSGSHSDYSHVPMSPRERQPAGLWPRNVQLALSSIIVGAVVVLFQPPSDVVIQGLNGDAEMLTNGFFSGFNALTWVVIGLQATGGLVTALAIKYADNISKGFALSIAICLSFVLSVFLFDFQITAAPVLGISLVAGSTLLFEADAVTINRLWSRQSAAHEYYSHPKRLKLWHLSASILFLVVFGLSSRPIPPLGISTSAWQTVATRFDANDRLPTIAIAEMESINEIVMTAAREDCKWGVMDRRSRSLDPYGAIPPQNREFPYHISDTDQYALDDILTTRMIDYPNTAPYVNYNQPVDFIFIPIHSQIYSNPWNCNSPKLLEGIAQTTAFIREMVRLVGVTPYPRIIIPIATIRSNLEKELFTVEFMEEMKNSVIILGIENALKSTVEGMTYTIDVPYPTRYHTMQKWTAKERSGTDETEDYFLNQDRPYLLSYAAAASHPWGLSPKESFNGFALRNKLHQQLSTFVAEPLGRNRVLFDDITNPFDGAQNLTTFQDHMMHSIFCLQPSGDSPTRRGFYDAIQLGCIPVIFRKSSYGRLFPSSPEFDTSLFTVYVDENDILNDESIIERLASISGIEIRRKQRHLRSIAASSNWALPARNLYYPLSPQSSRPPLGNVPTWNKVMETKLKPGSFSNDAFGLVLRELAAIKGGKFKPRFAQDVKARSKREGK